MLPCEMCQLPQTWKRQTPLSFLPVFDGDPPSVDPVHIAAEVGQDGAKDDDEAAKYGPADELKLNI